jgi:hypothetical protein
VGYVLYVAAAALVIVGLVTVIRDDGSDTTDVNAAATATLPSPTTRAVAAVTTTAPAADDAPAVNSAPVIIAPEGVTVGHAGVTPVGGLSIVDVEARANDDKIGLILYAAAGTIHIGRTTGLEVYEDNPGAWIPVIGRLSAVNAALKTVGYESRSSSTRQQLLLIVSDFGGSARQQTRLAQKAVTVLVS